jgi:diadenylate cyclase
MPQFVDSALTQLGQLWESIFDQVRPSTVLDIGITALLIYWLFSLIRGTRAVRLVFGVSLLFGLYVLAQWLDLRLVTQILQTGAVVGVFAFVVVFQPELRRALERIGRVGSFAWLISPAEERQAERVASIVARAAASLSALGHGALIVLERETGLEEIAETGVMIHGDLSADLLLTIFMPRTALHDGAVIVRGDRILAAGALLPLAETTLQSQRFGTRHRAALGITEQTDAVVVVVSEENGQVSLVERARIVRNLSEAQLARAIVSLLSPASARRSLLGRDPDAPVGGARPRRRPTFPTLGGRVGGGGRIGRSPDVPHAERFRAGDGDASASGDSTTPPPGPTPGGTAAAASEAAAARAHR